MRGARQENLSIFHFSFPFFPSFHKPNRSYFLNTAAMRVVTLGLPLLMLNLSGCVKSMGPAYVPSADHNAAQITFISNSGGINMAAFSWKGPLQGCVCSSEPAEVIGVFFNKAALVKESNRYADKGKHTNQFSVSVPPGKEFRFSVPVVQYHIESLYGSLHVTTEYCQAHESFKPENNAAYEVVYDLNVSQCGFSVYKLENDRKVQVETSKYPLCSPVKEPAWDDWVSRQILEECPAQQKNAF